MTNHDFHDPGQEFRGVTLWMLNDRLEPGGIAARTRGFRDAGWGALIARTFAGLRTEYLSREWHDAVRTIIGEASKNGLKTWLQAGYMPSAVPDLPEDEQHRILVRRGAEDPPRADEKILLERDGVLYCEGRVASVIDLLDDEACEKYLERAYTDTLEPEYGKSFGKEVEAIWVDEPHLQPPALTWSKHFEERFQEDWGYPITEHLPSLFTHEGDWRKIRHHYWRTVLRLLLDAYFRRIGEWCSSRNLKFCGHLMGEDTLRSQISWTGACMPGYEYMHLPGIDHLTKSLEWPANLPFILPPIQCASAAHQLGRREILSEIYAVSTEGLSFADRKRIGDWMMVLGINYRCYHGSFYSIRGRRKRFYVPHLSHQQPWWEHNGIIASYFARFSYLMRQGTFDAEILLLHPVESGFCLYDPTKLAPENVHNRADEPGDIRKLNDAFEALSALLLGLHRSFDYGDETLMAKHGSVDGALLRVGGMAYRVVILPPLITLRESTYALLSRFLDAGGTVLSAGDFPDRIDGNPDPRALALARRAKRISPDARSLKQALDSTLPAPLELAPGNGSDASSVWIHRRIDGDERIIALVNVDASERVDGVLTLRENGRLEDWDLMTGTVEAAPYERTADGVRVRVSLPPGASKAFVLITGAAPVGVKPVPSYEVSKRTVLGADWRAKRLSPNALTLDFCAWRSGNGPWSEPLPVQAVQELLTTENYRGPISLRFAFEVKDRPSALNAVVEDPEEYVSILVNGNPVSYAGLPPYLDEPLKPIDIAAFVKPGVNTVELTRDFVPLSKAKFHLATLFHTAVGVELEAVYLTGDFALQAAASARPGAAGCVRLSPQFSLVSEPASVPGDLVTAGYPFFAGRFVLEQDVELTGPAPGERLYLTLPRVDAALIGVRVNGKDAGAIAWAPFELEITSLVRSGKNLIELELVGSLRNLIGPHHRPDGEPTQTWADGWTGYSTAERRETKLIAGGDWYAHRNDGTVYWTDDYFFLAFGTAGKAAVELRRPV